MQQVIYCWQCGKSLKKTSLCSRCPMLKNISNSRGTIVDFVLYCGRNSIEHSIKHIQLVLDGKIITIESKHLLRYRIRFYRKALQGYKI